LLEFNTVLISIPLWSFGSTMSQILNIYEIFNHKYALLLRSPNRVGRGTNKQTNKQKRREHTSILCPRVKNTHH